MCAASSVTAAARSYYAIAEKATIKKPSELNVKKDKFSETFSEDWDKVLAENRAFNALDACKELDIDGKELDTLWGQAKANKKLVKMGGGFYCGLVEKEGKAPIYTFNAFFMEMRGKFTKEGACASRAELSATHPRASRAEPSAL